MEVLESRALEQNAIQNIVKWVGEIDEREDMLPLGNREEMMALLENAKGAQLSTQEMLVAHHMLIYSVVN